MFAAGEMVVYGGEGVCRVEGVGTPSLPGMDKTRLYYTLAPLYRSGQVMTPVDTRVLMRPLLIDLRYNGQFRSKHDVVLPDGRQLDKLRTYNVALSFGYLF